MYSLSGAAWGLCFHITSQELLGPVWFCAQAHCLVRRKKTEHTALSSIYQYTGSSLQLEEVLNHVTLMCTLYSHTWSHSQNIFLYSPKVPLSWMIEQPFVRVRGPDHLTAIPLGSKKDFLSDPTLMGYSTAWVCGLLFFLFRLLLLLISWKY